MKFYFYVLFYKEKNQMSSDIFLLLLQKLAF